MSPTPVAPATAGISGPDSRPATTPGPNTAAPAIAAVAPRPATTARLEREGRPSRGADTARHGRRGRDRAIRGGLSNARPGRGMRGMRGTRRPARRRPCVVPAGTSQDEERPGNCARADGAGTGPTTGRGIESSAPPQKSSWVMDSSTPGSASASDRRARASASSRSAADPIGTSSLRGPNQSRGSRTTLSRRPSSSPPLSLSRSSVSTLPADLFSVGVLLGRRYYTGLYPLGLN